MKKKKIIIIVWVVILVLIVISTLLSIFFVSKNKENEKESNINIEELENNFNTIFKNTIYPETEENKTKVYLKYNIETTETGKYKIDTSVPGLEIKSEEAEKINNDIFSSFVRPIAQILNQEGAYIIYNVDYVSYINNNILSIVVKCNLKEGSNPQKIIIRTYNYDMEANQILTLDNVLNIKNINQEEVQNRVFEKVNEEIQKVSAIQNSGYNVYKRDINSEIYKIENTKEFFLGENNVLYIVYPYGNSSYTSEIDLVIFE